MEFKAIISLIVVSLTIAGYIPYILDIFKGKTKPHMFSWLSGSIGASLAFFIQIEGGAGVGSWTMLAVAITCTSIFILSFKYGTRDIIKLDSVFLFLSLAALFIWLVIDQPIVSIILLTIAQLSAFIPTVRKSWNDPHSETLAFYKISSLRHILAIFALEKINILTALYPSAWVLVNILMVLILVVRRKILTGK